MGVQWGYHGGTMGVPWGYHGGTMGVPWVPEKYILMELLYMINEFFFGD